MIAGSSTYAVNCDLAFSDGGEALYYLDKALLHAICRIWAYSNLHHQVPDIPEIALHVVVASMGRRAQIIQHCSGLHGCVG